MYYIEQQNDEIVKYEVEIDREKLEKIKYEVIKNCGEIKHYCYRDVGCHHNQSAIFDYHQKWIGKSELNDFYNSEVDIYEYEYNQYLNTTLVILINRLLRDDMSAILEIKNPKENKKKSDNEQQLQKKIGKILSLDMKDIDILQLEKMKKELEEYQTIEKLNRDRKSDLEYYPQVLSCIMMKEVSKIMLDDLIQIEELMDQVNDLLKQVRPFFEKTDKENICTNQCQKVIQKLYDKNNNL